MVLPDRETIAQINLILNCFRLLLLQCWNFRTATTSPGKMRGTDNFISPNPKKIWHGRSKIEGVREEFKSKLERKDNE